MAQLKRFWSSAASSVSIVDGATGDRLQPVELGHRIFGPESSALGKLHCQQINSYKTTQSGMGNIASARKKAAAIVGGSSSDGGGGEGKTRPKNAVGQSTPTRGVGGLAAHHVATNDMCGIRSNACKCRGKAIYK